MQFTETQLDDAYAWLCHRRRHFPPNADIWHLRFHWAREKADLFKALSKRRYQFSPLQVVQKADGEVIHLWSAQDALVLKMLTSLLAGVLPVSPACTHVKGHGGQKATVRQVYNQLPNYRFVLRTDVKEYYASIDHYLLMEQLAKFIKDKFILNLLWQYLHQMVNRGGLYKEIQQGISRGCPLSPLISAFFLNDLDQRFQKDGLFYVRYMDDILILTPTRWKLRHAVQALNQSLAEAKLEKHPDKTFIGRIEKGFDFLGYHFNPEGLSVAVVTWEKFAARWHRLYEQKSPHPERRGLLGDYVRRWQRWALAGIGLVTWERQALRTLKTPLESGAGNAKHRSILCACFTSGYAD